jgi:hypothetical protein
LQYPVEPDPFHTWLKVRNGWESATLNLIEGRGT